MNFLVNHKIQPDVNYRSETLGFALTDPSAINAFMHNEDLRVMSTDSLNELLQAYINVILNGAQSKELKVESDRTVYINNLGIDMLNFDISQQQKLSLINEGYISTLEYLKNHELLIEDENDLVSNFKLWNLPENQLGYDVISL